MNSLDDAAHNRNSLVMTEQRMFAAFAKAFRELAQALNTCSTLMIEAQRNVNADAALVDEEPVAAAAARKTFRSVSSTRTSRTPKETAHAKEKSTAAESAQNKKRRVFANVEVDIMALASGLGMPHKPVAMHLQLSNPAQQIGERAAIFHWCGTCSQSARRDRALRVERMGRAKRAARIRRRSR